MVQFFDVLAKDAHAETVKCRDQRRSGKLLPAQKFLHTRTHFLSGFIGEGDRENIPRRDAFFSDQIGNAVSDDARLAGTAPASINSGPSVAITASRCSEFSALRKSVISMKSIFLRVPQITQITQIKEMAELLMTNLRNLRNLRMKFDSKNRIDSARRREYYHAELNTTDG